MISKGLIWLVRVYQFFVSPVVGPCCRFFPTCSEFATEALLRHGTLTGMWLILGRIVRCHPFCEGGHDPVPDRRRQGS